MMPLFFGNLPNFIGESQCINKILESKGALKLPDAISFKDRPFRHLLQIGCRLFVSDLWCASPAHLTLHLLKILHTSSPSLMKSVCNDDIRPIYLRLVRFCLLTFPFLNLLCRSFCPL